MAMPLQLVVTVRPFLIAATQTLRYACQVRTVHGTLLGSACNNTMAAAQRTALANAKAALRNMRNMHARTTVQ